MAGMSGLSSANHFNLYVTIGPLFLPFLVLLTYLIYCLLKYCCYCIWTAQHHHQHLENNPLPSEQQPILAPPPTTTEVTLDDYIQDDLYADRILNPGLYDQN